jgi:hypothetical protein
MYYTEENVDNLIKLLATERPANAHRLVIIVQSERAWHTVEADFYNDIYTILWPPSYEIKLGSFAFITSDYKWICKIPE